MLRTMLAIAYLWPWFLCQSLPLMSSAGSRMGGSVRSAYKAGGAPGDSFSRVVGAGCEVSGVRQAMRLSLLGVGLLAGTHSSSAAQLSTGETRLCSSTLALDKVVNPPARVEDQIVVTKPSDERMYKALTLKNELRVLLVSDPSASRSAAAMDVHVGSMSDPDDIPGLAHFCEHMSFLGTKKFPDEEGFTSFLASHGGSSNAYTDNEDTVYYFDVNAEFLSASLERFAQFFAAPLFTEGATSRELNAIDSEHAKNINNDGFRVYQVKKTITYAFYSLVNHYSPHPGSAVKGRRQPSASLPQVRHGKQANASDHSLIQGNQRTTGPVDLSLRALLCQSNDAVYCGQGGSFRA